MVIQNANNPVLVNREAENAPRILLVAGDVAYNMGDRAIRHAIVDQIHDVFPHAELFGMSRTPERDRREFGISVIAPDPFTALRQRRLLQSMHLVIWGGGHPLQDDSSKVKNLYWAVLTSAIRRSTRCTMIGYGLGIGPLQTRWGRYFAGHALRHLDSCVARDERSARWVSELTTPRTRVLTAPDPAVSLRPASREEALAYLASAEGLQPRQDETLIGVAMRQCFHVHNNLLPYRWTRRLRRPASSGHERFQMLKRNVTDALNRVSPTGKARILFFPMYAASWQDDAVHDREIAAGLNGPSHVLHPTCSTPLWKAVMGLCDVFVGVSMHSTILAMGMGVPTIGLHYSDKGHDLFTHLEENPRRLSVEAIAEADGAERLGSALADTLAHRQEIRSRLLPRWHKMESECGVYRRVLEEVVSKPAHRETRP